MKTRLNGSGTRGARWFAWAVLLILFAIPVSTERSEAGYRGFTDSQMSSYISRSRRTITIDHGIGGYVQGTVRNLSHILSRNKRVVINGPCQSACTLFLSLGPGRVCITRKAEFWFHQASYLTGKRSRYWSRAMMKLYPSRIRSYIRRKGGLRRKWIVLKGKRLRKLYPHLCRNI